MTAAQALAPGLTAPPSAGRSSKGTGDGDHGGKGFHDALESASDTSSGSREARHGGSEAQSGEGASSVDAATGSRGVEAAAARGTEQSQTQRAILSVEADVAPRDRTSLMERLKAVVAHAGGTGQGRGAAEGGAEHSRDAKEGGPVLPGLVDPDGEDFDAARLLAIMRSRGAEGVSTAGGATVVTVLGQERHLALGRLPADVAQQLGDDQQIAAQLRGEAKAASHAASLSAQTDAGADGLERVRGKANGDEVRIAAEGAVGRRGAMFASDGRGQSGAGLGENGQDGSRQHEGRGGANGSSANSGAFGASLQNPGVQTPSAVRGQGVTQHESVGEQIAARIRADLNADGLGEASSNGVVKVLKIELKPANLGAVTLRMSLKDNVITVHVETQSAETQALIEREQAKLSKTLSSAGYTVDAITATQGDASRAATAVSTPGGDSASASFQQSGGQAHGQNGQSEFAGEGRPGRSSAGGDEGASAGGGKDNGAPGARTDADGVYV